ncbi:unnamed protein product [Withania somnifera]
MENQHLISSPTNNTISEDDLISASHINDLPISAVLSNTNSNGGQLKSAKEIDDYINSLPPGFRFCPTDVELVTQYLKRKLANLPLQPNRIYEINIYKYNPETIAAQVKPTTGEKVWYILTPRDRKYRNGKRPSRSAGNGYWKATGADKPIRDNNKTLIGLKKALVFYIGKPPKGEKTDWIMHEYRVPETPNIVERHVNDWTLDEWVLCKIYKKSDTDNTMFTQRKRSRENHEDIDEVTDAYDGQVHESSNENLSIHDLHESFCEDFTRNDPMNRIDMLGNHNNNHATTFHPQVPTSLSTFPHIPALCNTHAWSITSAYDQNCVSQFNNFRSVHDIFHHHIEPISFAKATNTSIGHDPTQGFGCHSCIGGGYIGQEYYGEYLEPGADQCDLMDYVNQYLDKDMINGPINVPTRII